VVLVLSFDFRRWLLVAAAVFVPATLLHAALPADTNVPNRIFLTGQLLIASPQLRQSAFDHAVVLIAQHNRDGAFGIVINRPIDKKPIAKLLAAFGADASGITDSVRIFAGGPVDPAVALVLHSTDYRRLDTMDIDGRIGLTAAVDVLRDIGTGKGPKKSLVAFGYAGWAPAQMEDEVARGVWVTMPEDLDLVFDEDRSKVWADALARLKPGR
jgi:putative transcriptional regulator